MLGRLLALLFCSIPLIAQAPNAKPSNAPTGFRIAGIVYDSTSGQTLPGARISLGSTAAEKGPDRSVLSGPDGAFAFEHLGADKYQIYGEAVGYPQQGFEQHEAPFLTGVVVGPEIAADHLVFRLQRGSVISGFVTDEFNEPVRQAQVMLFHRGLENGRFSTHFSRQEQTDDQGHYKFASLLPGAYFLAVIANPWYAHNSLELTMQSESLASPQVIENMKRLDVAYPLTFYSGATSASDATEIAIRSGERTTADISLHSVPSASVTVKASAQKNGPMPFVRFSHQVFDFEIPAHFQQRGGYPTIGADGTSTGPADIFFTGVAPGSYLAHVTIPGGEGERVQEIEIGGNTTIDADSISAPGTAAIQGVVQMSGGMAPPSNVYIALQNRKTRRVHGAIADVKGDFEVNDLQPGVYEVSLANAADVFLLDMAATNAKVSGRALTLSGAASAELAITLGKGMGNIHGVALRDGQGLGGTMVLLIPGNGESTPFLFRRDQSDSDGTFALQRIVPGHYSIVAIDNGWDLEWSRPEALRPYLAKAEKIDVAANGKYEIRVQVQAR